MVTSSIAETEKKAFAPTSERSLSAIFKTQKDVEAVVERLKARGIPIEHISVLGRDFSSDTRIAGFITKKDVILGGLKRGAIFGSLFGSVLSLLTGVGILFIPFVGPVVAAGPLGAALLGAASGAIAGSAGAGLASFLTTLGMPEDKAAIYQTKVSAGEYLVMVEVPVEGADEYQSLVESIGGQEVHLSDASLPRPCDGECGGPEELAPEVRSHLCTAAQLDFVATYNRILKESDDAGKAEHEAWDMIRMKYQEDELGVWS